MTRKSIEILSACIGFAVVAPVMMLAAYVCWRTGFDAAVIAIGAAYGALSVNFIFDVVRAARRD